MLTAARALVRHVEDGKPLPKVAELEALYRYGFQPKWGETFMIAGRSGSQKSGFALWWTAKMNLPTLYFSGDMSGYTASCRLAQMQTGDSLEMVTERMTTPEGRRRYWEATEHLNLQFSFGKPIRWSVINEEIDAFVELHDGWPSVFVFDNLMDFEGGESNYEAQMQTMQHLDALKGETGSAVVILHHASDKSWDARTDPWAPPSRDQIKNGMSEKPDSVVSVGLDPHSFTFSMAVLKQRMGAQDPTAQTRIRLLADPVHTRFHPYPGLEPVNR